MSSVSNLGLLALIHDLLVLILVLDVLVDSNALLICCSLLLGCFISVNLGIKCVRFWLWMDAHDISLVEIAVSSIHKRLDELVRYPIKSHFEKSISKCVDY